MCAYGRSLGVQTSASERRHSIGPSLPSIPNYRQMAQLYRAGHSSMIFSQGMAVDGCVCVCVSVQFKCNFVISVPFRAAKSFCSAASRGKWSAIGSIECIQKINVCCCSLKCISNNRLIKVKWMFTQKPYIVDHFIGIIKKSIKNLLHGSHHKAGVCVCASWVVCLALFAFV